ncbi:hypothetical protein YB2330_004975 [Saitoella coloradoensis]
MSPMKTAVITGANRGIGLEFARQYLEKGFHVIACARSLSTSASSFDKLSAVLQTFEKVDSETSGKLSLVQLDLASDESIQRAGEQISTMTDSIDVLINNAGRNDVKADKPWEFDSQGFAEELRTNTIAPSVVTKTLLPLLRKGQAKKVLFVSSVCGSLANSSGENTMMVYHTSKAALNMTVKYWAHALKAEGIATVMVHPGWVQTDMGGEGAQVTPKDSVAGMIKVLEKVTPESEVVLHKYDGTTIEW